jgi:hypothetical protein
VAHPAIEFEARAYASCIPQEPGYPVLVILRRTLNEARERRFGVGLQQVVYSFPMVNIPSRVPWKLLAIVLWAWIPLCWEPLWAQPPGGQTKVGTTPAQANQRGTQNSPLVVDILSQPKSAQEAAEEKKAAERKTFVDTWTLRLAFAVALFTGLLVLVGGGGVLLANRTLRAIESQTKATRDSVDVLIDSERAWILVEIGELPPFQPDPNQVQFLYIAPAIKSFGKTPARIKRIVGRIQLMPEGEKLPAEPAYPSGQSSDLHVDTVLPPNAHLQPMRFPVSGEEFIRVTEGGLTLYAHGYIDYMDVNGKSRHSGFCYVYCVQGGFSPYPTGFYVDFSAPSAYTECT